MLLISFQFLEKRVVLHAIDGKTWNSGYSGFDENRHVTSTTFLFSDYHEVEPWRVAILHC
jgi:hypothetical protein